MAGYHAVGACTAHRQGRTRYVTNGHLQNRLVRTMVYGKGNIYLRYIHITHDTGAGNIQYAPVLLYFCIRKIKIRFLPRKLLIV